MEDETQVEETTLETPEEVEVEAAEEETEEEVDWKAKAEKAEELANNYKARAEKAEKKAKSVKAEAPTSSLSTVDILALSKANIEPEDIDEVLEWANFKKISVVEALNSSVLKATLAEKSEQRKSAQAVNTGATRRGTSSVSDDRLLADAEKGIMPDSEADIARLARLRFKR